MNEKTEETIKIILLLSIIGISLGMSVLTVIESYFIIPALQDNQQQLDKIRYDNAEEIRETKNKDEDFLDELNDVKSNIVVAQSIMWELTYDFEALDVYINKTVDDGVISRAEANATVIRFIMESYSAVGPIVDELKLKDYSIFEDNYKKIVLKFSYRDYKDLEGFHYDNMENIITDNFIEGLDMALAYEFKISKIKLYIDEEEDDLYESRKSEREEFWELEKKLEKHHINKLQDSTFFMGVAIAFLGISNFLLIIAKESFERKREKRKKSRLIKWVLIGLASFFIICSIIFISISLSLYFTFRNL